MAAKARIAVIGSGLMGHGIAQVFALAGHDVTITDSHQPNLDTVKERESQGYVVPDSFTHGTSRQRMRWFKEGFNTGDVNRARLLFDLPYNEL